MGDTEFDDRLLVESHRRHTLRPAVHEDHRRFVDDLQPLLGRGDGAAHDERIDAVGERPGLRQFVGRALVGVGEEHGLTVGATAPLHGADHLSEEGVGDVGNEHADGADPASGQVSSEAIRGVAQFVDRCVDRGTRRLTDELRAAEDPRHRARVHTRFDGDVGEGDRTSRHHVLPSSPRGRQWTRRRLSSVRSPPSSVQALARISRIENRESRANRHESARSLRTAPGVAPPRHHRHVGDPAAVPSPTERSTGGRSRHTSSAPARRA